MVTARNVERGDLVGADANGGTALFSIQRDDVIRVQCYVPQSSAAGLREGLDARVTLPEMPGHPFNSRVARTALTLDPTSRTLLVEIDVTSVEVNQGLQGREQVALRPPVDLQDGQVVRTQEPVKAPRPAS